MKKLILFLALIFASLSINAKQIPVEDFFKYEDIRNLYLSPTGEYLAAVFQDDEKYKIATLDTNTLKLIKVIGVADKKEVLGVQWVNDERFIFTVSRQFGAFARPSPTGEVFASNYDGTQQMLMPFNFRVRNLLPEDPKHVIGVFYDRQGHSKVKRVRLYDKGADNTIASRTKTKTTYTLDSSPFRGSVLLDHNGTLRIANDFDQDKTTDTYYRDNKSAEWEKIHTSEAGKPGLVFRHFAKDNKHIYVYDNRPGKAGYYLFNPKTKESKLLWKYHGEGDISLVYDNGWPVAEPIGIFRHNGIPEVEYFNPSGKLESLLANVQKAFPNDFVNKQESTKDGKKSLLHVKGDTNPGDYYLLDNETNQVKFLASNASWIKPKEMPKREPFSFKARDGLKIHGYLTRPSLNAKNLPLIVLVHGGPFGVRDDWWWYDEAAFFANRGYAVLQVNYRGSGGYGQDFEYNAYRKVGAEMQDDLTDATLWAVEQGIADKDRLCIYGASYGGYAALMGAVREPDLYKCAVGYVGVYDIAIQKKSLSFETVSGRNWVDRAWNINDDKFVKERSPLYHVDKLKAALMLVHGESDRIVPVANYSALASALDSIDYPYESVLEANEGHGFYKEHRKNNLYKKMLKFFDKHIGD